MTTGVVPVLEITPIDYGASTIEVTVTDTARNSSVVRIKYSSVVAGIEEAQRSPFAVYPNPFRTTVSVTHSEKNHVVMIYNARGELIKQLDFPETIDLSEYPAGFYSSRRETAITIKC